MEFYKIQATGNDFIVVDSANTQPEMFNPSAIKNMCDRHYGIGADGFIALEKVKDFAFRFLYYNADGSRGEMCANGCRAAISFAMKFGWIKVNSKFNFLADDGEHTGIFKSDNEVQLNILVIDEIKEVELDLFGLPQWISKGYFIDTGVPHLVLVCTSELKENNIEKYGRFLRHHKCFEPRGTNVNFIEILSDNNVFVRTFERGVEAETLSCGTGITASALVVSAMQKKPTDKIKVLTKGGELEVLTINGQIYINGPAEIVFKGHI
ncbi:MAG: diaminopimelate epimerase [Calditrichaeota bacterium]|nr:MAG: diaminopimelate epimerase [Calditrichota bacterium]MBL1207559.1 diaminopimelate epimerase [Calditrichota bacterium]NOG47391.1 diaminopimelate epimerase [Calditrichota bacterium]